MSTSYDWNGASKSRHSRTPSSATLIDSTGSFTVRANDPALAFPTIAMANAPDNFTNQRGPVCSSFQPTGPHVTILASALPGSGCMHAQLDTLPDDASALMEVDNLPPSPPITPEYQIFALPVR